MCINMYISLYSSSQAHEPDQTVLPSYSTDDFTGLVQVKVELLGRDQAGRVLLVYEKAFFLMVLNYEGAGSLFFSDLELHREQGSKYTVSSNPSLPGTACFHFD